MRKLLITAIATTTLAASSAFAQTSPTPTTPAPTTPPASSPSTGMPSASTSGSPMVLSEAEAKTWVDKVIYSSDGKNIGEVAAVQRDTSGKVLEVHADIGGFLGMGETRVRVQPTQFTIEGDRLKLNMTADQAKALPKVDK